MTVLATAPRPGAAMMSRVIRDKVSERTGYAQPRSTNNKTISGYREHLKSGMWPGELAEPGE